jgi:DNA-binding transcriptional regulator/RsmH inhibitor MraZ
MYKIRYSCPHTYRQKFSQTDEGIMVNSSLREQNMVKKNITKNREQQKLHEKKIINNSKAVNVPSAPRTPCNAAVLPNTLA